MSEHRDTTAITTGYSVIRRDYIDGRIDAAEAIYRLKNDIPFVDTIKPEEHDFEATIRLWNRYKAKANSA
jgi:hypothetical protein